MSKATMFLTAFVLAGCAAHYRLPTDQGWGYDGDLNGMKMVAVFENQSVCETRRATGLLTQKRRGMTMALGTCEPITVTANGTPYWGIGVPQAAGFIFFRDEKTCGWFRSGWSEVPTWQKTECAPFALERSQPAK
jgi:hypothetical protein